MIKRLGIFGGTFDPIHMGHLLVAEMARQECDLDKVLFIPAANPPHKSDKHVSPPNYRLELRRQGKSYTIDTLKDLRKIYSEECEFWMIVGGDSFRELDTWRNAKELIKLCNFAVYMRPHVSIDTCKIQAEKIHGQANSRVLFVEAPMIDISSTDIRDRVAQGKSIRYMVPDAVRKYIIEKRLFKS